MYLAIEIGGTKLQLAVGDAAGSPLEVVERRDVDPAQGAEGIRNQIAQVGPELIRDYDVAAVGIGFGGPVDAQQGRIIKSFQIDGWDGFVITDWAEQVMQRPAVLGNDSDLAGLGEARYGAGRGHRIVFYSNVGSGIGGALVTDGQLYTGGVGGAAEIGHLRPGIASDSDQQTVESISSGWGMRTPLLYNDSEWWGRCFLCFSKVLDRRLPFVVLGFPVAWYAFPFAFRWF